MSIRNPNPPNQKSRAHWRMISGKALKASTSKSEPPTASGPRRASGFRDAQPRLHRDFALLSFLMPSVTFCPPCHVLHSPLGRRGKPARGEPAWGEPVEPSNCRRVPCLSRRMIQKPEAERVFIPAPLRAVGSQNLRYSRRLWAGISQSSTSQCRSLSEAGVQFSYLSEP
jgi:hypothetical protein